MTITLKCMRSAGLMVEVLIEYVELFRQGEETIATRKNILIEQRNQLVAKMEDMKKQLINWAIKSKSTKM